MSVKCHKRTPWSELFGSPAGRGNGPNPNRAFSAMGPDAKAKSRARACGWRLMRWPESICCSYSSQLVARNVPIADDLRITMKKSEFLVAAKKLANDKARDLGWTLRRRPLPLDKA